MSHSSLSRRDWLRLSAAGVLGSSTSGWFANLASAAVAAPRKRACILLWMNGGPSQMDTFDLKPGHRNGGPVKEIATSVPGIKISEYLPQVARWMNRLAVVRSLKAREPEHNRAAYHLRTGYLPQGAIHYPALGATLGKELGRPEGELPHFVSISPVVALSPGAYSSGFLGPQHAPLVINNRGFGNIGAGNPDRLLRVEDLEPEAGITRSEVDARLELLRDLQANFSVGRPDLTAHSNREAYTRAVRLMRSGARRAFELSEEPAKLRDAYGRNLFGQGCLLARRLVEHGVPFVEVTLAGISGVPEGWDTHNRNSQQVRRLCNVLDPAWTTLMQDLQDRGLLDTTTLVWMGEFGRTPRINPQSGRDHWSTGFSAVLGGGGIRGGQAIGRTGADGMEVVERPVRVQDFLATICRAVGVDPTLQNMSNVGRPIRIADAGAKPIAEVLR